MTSTIVLLVTFLAVANAGVIIQSDLIGETSPFGPLYFSSGSHGPEMVIPGASVIWGFNPHLNN